MATTCKSVRYTLQALILSGRRILPRLEPERRAGRRQDHGVQFEFFQTLLMMALIIGAAAIVIAWNARRQF